jgi:hypothetical protein
MLISFYVLVRIWRYYKRSLREIWSKEYSAPSYPPNCNDSKKSYRWLEEWYY